MLKEADVSKKGLLAFRECLSVVSSLTIDSIEELPAKDIPDYQAIVRGEGFKQIIILRGGNHPASAGGGSRAPLLKWVYATRSQPQPTQRVCNQLSPCLDTEVSQKGSDWKNCRAFEGTPFRDSISIWLSDCGS